MPQIMEVPIGLYDHLNDNLLFEYVLGSKLSIFDDNDTSGNAGNGLVETELGTEGTPVYKKETVLQVAKVKNAKYDEFLKKFGDGNDAIVMDNGDKLTISG